MEFLLALFLAGFTLANTTSPTLSPTLFTLIPTQSPTSISTLTPTLMPSPAPTLAPTLTPSLAPTLPPTLLPSPAPTLAPTQALCGLVRAPNLTATCMSRKVNEPPSPGLHVRQLSPVLRISSNMTQYVFVLPLVLDDSDYGYDYDLLCYDPRCLWESPQGLQSTDCEVTNYEVVLENGTFGIECSCTHGPGNYVFAIKFNEDNPPALCKTYDALFTKPTMLILFSVMGGAVLIQIVRTLYFKLFGATLAQHLVLLVVIVCRIALLVTISSNEVSDSFILFVLPSAFSLALFVHLMLAWSSVQLFSMSRSPFAKVRLPFIVIVALLFLVEIVLTIVALVSSFETKENVLYAQAYFLAGANVLICILVSISGVGLFHMLDRAGSSRCLYRVKVLGSTIGLSMCLSATSAFFIVTEYVQDDFSLFFQFFICALVMDLLSLCIFLILFRNSVQPAARGSQKRSQEKAHARLS